MKHLVLAGLVAFLALNLAACETIDPLERPDFAKGDALSLQAPAPSTVSSVITDDDKAAISLLHDRATVQCLWFKNRQSSWFNFAGVAMSDNDIFLATFPSALAAAGVSTGPLAVAAAVSAVLSTPFAKLVGLPTPSSDFSTTAAGLDTMYSTFVQSPGIARGLNDPKSRAATLKIIRIGYGQACKSTMKMPTSSVYSPAKAPAALTAVTP